MADKMAPARGERNSEEFGDQGKRWPLLGSTSRSLQAGSTARSDLPPSQPSLATSLEHAQPSQRNRSSSLRRGRSLSRGISRGRSYSRPPISSTPQAWNALFKAPSSSSQDLNLQYISPEINNGLKIAVYEKKDSADLVEAWSKALVGYVVGMHVSYSPLLSYIKSRWGTSSFELHILQNGFFVCKFDSEDDLRKVLEGFWTVKGHPMILRRWSSEVRMELDSLKSIPLWVSFHGLPLHLWTKEFIGKLCSTMGEPLYLDKMTAERKRLAYARACIMIPAEEDLPDFVYYKELDGSVKAIKVSYQWRPKRCQVCSSFGHVNGVCKRPEPKGKDKVQVFKAKDSSNMISISNSFAALQNEKSVDERPLEEDVRIPPKAHRVQRVIQAASTGNLIIDNQHHEEQHLLESDKSDEGIKNSKFDSYISPSSKYGASMGKKLVGASMEDPETIGSSSTSRIVHDMEDESSERVLGMQDGSHEGRLHKEKKDKDSNKPPKPNLKSIEADIFGVQQTITNKDIRDKLHGISGGYGSVLHETREELNGREGLLQGGSRPPDRLHGNTMHVDGKQGNQRGDKGYLQAGPTATTKKAAPTNSQGRPPSRKDS